MQTSTTLFSVLSALVLPACASNHCGKAAPPAATAADEPAALPATARPATLSPGAAQSIHRIGGKLLVELGKEPGNTLLSPSSVHAVLTLAQLGAGGQSATEFEELLGTPANAETARALGALYDDLTKEREGVTLRSAAGLFVHPSQALHPDYLRDVATPLHALVEAMSSDPAAARSRINGWVSDSTLKLIPEVLPDGSIDEDTRAVLVNATYFRGAWKTPFDAARTAPAPFVRADGSTVQVPMMRDKQRVGYARASFGTLAELPYRDERFAMAFVLPSESTQAVLAAFASGELQAALQNLGHSQVELAIPRFSVTTRPRSLSAPLQTLGLRHPFSPGADFGKLLSKPEPLQLDDVFHTVQVTVDEQGAEAAAATAATVKWKSRTPELKLDRPFVFLIRDRTTGAILFAGRIDDPTA